MIESRFQKKVKDEIKKMLPGSIVLKNDPNYVQGIPDLIILYGERWAALECKRNENATHQPNQDYYVDELNRMGFASFIYPENYLEVLDELEEYMLA